MVLTHRTRGQTGEARRIGEKQIGERPEKAPGAMGAPTLSPNVKAHRTLREGALIPILRRVKSIIAISIALVGSAASDPSLG